MHNLVTDEDFRTLAAFRKELRKFLNFSEKAALAVGLAPQQHQALLAIRGADQQKLSVGELAEALLVQPHSASELASRLETLGLVTREVTIGDSRRRIVVLTERGLDVLASLSAVHRAELLRLRPLLLQLLNSLN